MISAHGDMNVCERRTAEIVFVADPPVSGIYSYSQNTLNSPLPQARPLESFFIFLPADVLVKT